jgi:hypothetical protein
VRRTVMLLLATLVSNSCAPWYVKHGFRSEEETRRLEALPRLRAAMQKDPYVFWHVGENGWVRLGDPALDALLPSLSDTQNGWRVSILQVLAKIKSRRAVPALIKCLADEASTVRQGAAVALGQSGDASPNVLEALGQAARNDSSPDVREAAVEALGRIGDSVPHVLDVLKQVAGSDQKSSVREMAAKVLRKLTMDGLAAGKTSAPRLGAIAALDKVAPVPGPAPSPAKKAVQIIAIFDIEDAARRFDTATLDQLTEYLASKVAELGSFKVVPRNQIRARLLQEKRRSFKKCYDETCQIELGKAVAAQKSLSTKLLRVGNQCAITSNLYDLKSETAERAVTAETDCSTDALMTGIRSMVKKLAAR